MNEETMTTISHLGPYDVSEVNDDILGDVIYNQEIPIIVKQRVGDKTVFAVVAKNKDVKIACVGCFRRDMKITDNTRCKKCSSFVKHWDLKDGQRRLGCKETGSDIIKNIAANCHQVTMDFDVKNNDSVETIDTSNLIAELKRRGGILNAVTDEEIFTEVKKRKLDKFVAEDLTEEDLECVMTAKGVLPLFEARPTRLIHELRRQARKVGIQMYYQDEKKSGLPHCTDEVGASLIEKDGRRETRQSGKKRTMASISFTPRSATDFSLEVGK